MLVLRSLIFCTILLQHSSYGIRDNAWIFFIKTSEDSPCTAQPCLTLNQLDLNTTDSEDAYTRADIILQFGNGNHKFLSTFTFSNITKFSMLSKDKNNTIACSQLSGFIFNNVSTLMLINLTSIGCGNNKGFLQISQVYTDISVCTFLYSKGNLILAVQANITTKNCTFTRLSAGVLIAKYNTTMLDIGSSYILNVISKTLLYLNSSSANFANSIFKKNFAINMMIYVRYGILTLKKSELVHNRGHRLLILQKSTTNIYDSNFTHNYVFPGTQLMLISFTNLIISNSIFAHNLADQQTNILRIIESKVETSYSIIIHVLHMPAMV